MVKETLPPQFEFPCGSSVHGEGEREGKKRKVEVKKTSIYVSNEVGKKKWKDKTKVFPRFLLVELLRLFSKQF